MVMTVDPVFKKTLLEDGVAFYPKLLDAKLLARVQTCFDWSIAHPSPKAINADEGDTIYRIDNQHPDALDFYRDTIIALPFARLLQQVWDSEHIWYYAEETFWKKGDAARTVWHQDTTYQVWSGDNIVNCWMSLDPVPKSHSLEVIRGSHRGTRYDGSAFDPDDPTAPLWGDTPNPWGKVLNLPRLPDIEADRKRDPASWDVVSFEVEPGDVVFAHPASLHGGAPVDSSYRERRTLVLRFFGDGVVWNDIPDGKEALHGDTLNSTVYGVKRGLPGTPFNTESYFQVL